MFAADNIRARLRERPFRPLRVVTSRGQTYDVYHPDLIWVGRRFLMIGTPTADDPTLPDQVTRVAVLHVTELRDLPHPGIPSDGAPTS